MVISHVLDTNVVLYHLSGRLNDRVPVEGLAVSVVTELELFSFPDLSTEDERNVRGFLKAVEVVGIDEEVKAATIRLRRQRRMRLPDAIIAGTAIAHGALLWTNDQRLLGIEGVKFHPITMKP
ncbi:MAG: type II toxin-antitoxin system VapC family toxin [Dehalococcoidia bacterium]